MLGQNHFGAAAADVHHQDAFAGLRPASQHAQVNQPGFFLPGNDFHRRAQGLGRAFQKLLLVAGVAHRAGGHRAHADDVQLLINLRHALQIGAHERHGIGGDAAIVEHARAQPRDLPLGGQDLGGHARACFGGLHAYGVAANIDGGVTRHTLHSIVAVFVLRQIHNLLMFSVHSTRIHQNVIMVLRLPLMPLLVPNRYRGKLIVVEGIDGSGKSTQLSLLSQWLRSQCIAVAFSEWNSSPLVRETTKRGKKKNMFTPVTFSLIHATDFADRLERYIVPLVKSGAVVCADRYAYTAFARDVVRGVSRRWVRNLYRFALRPNLAFYFRVPLEVAIGRILGGRNAIKFYEAGMDLGLSRNVEESFRIFQGRILDEYEAMIQEVGFHVIDATGSIEEQQQQMRDIVMRELGESLRNGVMRASPGDLDAAQTAARIL